MENALRQPAHEIDGRSVSRIYYHTLHAYFWFIHYLLNRI